MGMAVQSYAENSSGGGKPKLKNFAISHLPQAWRFIKFCLVGGSGVLVDMGILFLLADPQMFGLNITVSKICAAEIALINNFIWNDVWTFVSSRNSKSRTASLKSERFGVFRRFLIFNTICGVGIGIAVALLYLFHTRFGWNVYVSNLLAIVLVTLWNFGVNARCTWKAVKSE
jgi:dolichol-phosphate mannosyltransferase